MWDAVSNIVQFVWKTLLPYLGLAGMIASVALQISGYRNQQLAKILFVLSALILLVPLFITLPWLKLKHFFIDHRIVSIILIGIIGGLISAGAATVFLPLKKTKRPLDIDRSIALGEAIIIPSPEDEKKTLVYMQLIPPLEDEFPNRYIINGVIISFENNGATEDRDVSMKVYLPGVKKIACRNELIQVVDGGYEGSTYLNLFTRSLKPNEKCSCKVDFTQVINNIRTVTEWKDQYGPSTAWSKLRNGFDVLVYRTSFGPKEAAPPNSPHAFIRKATFHLK